MLLFVFNIVKFKNLKCFNESDSYIYFALKLTKKLLESSGKLKPKLAIKLSLAHTTFNLDSTSFLSYFVLTLLKITSKNKYLKADWPIFFVKPYILWKK